MPANVDRSSDESHDFIDLFENGAIGLHFVGPDGIILNANRAELGMVVNKLNSENPREAIDVWRRGRDLNSRSPFEDSGFQDRHVRPLRHPSVP